MRSLEALWVRLILVSMLLLTTLVACSEDQQRLAPATDRLAAWRQDLGVLAQNLSKYHKNAFFKISKADFDEAVTRLHDAIPQMSDAEIRVALARIAASIGDGHTSIGLLTRESLVYPIGFYWFEDGIYALQVLPEHSRALGARLVEIGDRAVDDAVRIVGEVISRDNDAWLRHVAPQYLVTAEILHALGISPDPTKVTYTLAGPDGVWFKITLEAVPVQPRPQFTSIKRDFQLSQHLYSKNWEQHYWYEYLEDTHIVYVSYKRCRDMPSLPARKFFTDLVEFLEKNQVERLVIDL